MADAQRIAGEDLEFLMPVCNPQPAVRAAPSAAMERCWASSSGPPAPEPAQAFDNFYFVGSGCVSAWVLKTSDGLILIDALNNSAEAADLIEGGMRKLDGPGADQLRDRHPWPWRPLPRRGDARRSYRAHVVASEIDWEMMESGLEFDSPQWGRPPSATSP